MRTILLLFISLLTGVALHAEDRMNADVATRAASVAADDSYVYIGPGVGLFRTRRRDKSVNRTPVTGGHIMVSKVGSGFPRQFCVMWQNSRCSILFDLLVPDGK